VGRTIPFDLLADPRTHTRQPKRHRSISSPTTISCSSSPISTPLRPTRAGSTISAYLWCGSAIMGLELGLEAYARPVLYEDGTKIDYIDNSLPTHSGRGRPDARLYLPKRSGSRRNGVPSGGTNVGVVSERQDRRLTIAGSRRSPVAAHRPYSLRQTDNPGTTRLCP
jgi:hypothetical protein